MSRPSSPSRKEGMFLPETRRRVRRGRSPSGDTYWTDMPGRPPPDSGDPTRPGFLVFGAGRRETSLPAPSLHPGRAVLLFLALGFLLIRILF